MNTAIFERFRQGCDAFFEKKNAFFKDLKEELNTNLAKKKELVEKAEALMESTDWRSTGDILINLQKQWKEIGAVPRKYSDELWKRFSAAADRFFETKRDAARKAKATVRAKATAKEGVSLYRLRDNLQQEIKTAENNILFFTAKSKTANKLVDDMQRKINDLKKQLDEVKAQIKEQENE
jgi:cell division septum initiation protein DivIVA